MKLLVITSLKEYQKKVAQIMDLSGISVFSITETIGFKDQHSPNLLDNWFGSGNENFDSVFLFSFTDEEKADKTLLLVKKFNAEDETGFPIHAFILPVDKSTYALA
ncbi:hypothetical protein [Chryseolinea lacunae]|uniref:Transcriptional regulator n=1 Tax=Chryseolinea lacunae TaxID=2801331 RepID=A0ABS1KXL0_9BACT|nr:hypothetical protein [Chryseolinea lacunae]MBL0744195.1 hypothetical protein [Chryseolinea lacunae]